MGADHGVPKPLQQKHQRPQITDHHRYKNNENVSNTVRIPKRWHKDAKWAHAIEIMAPIDLLAPGLPQPSICKRCDICEAQQSNAQ